MDLSFSSLPPFAAVTTWLNPLWMVAVGVLAAVSVLIGVFLLLQQLLPKIAAIARTTAKEALTQPLFYVLLAIGVFSLILFPFVPYNTFGEDVKVVKDEVLVSNSTLKMLPYYMWFESQRNKGCLELRNKH